MPGDEYLKDPETVNSWKFGLTTVQWRKEDLKKRLEESRAMACGQAPVDMEPSGEEGILLMRALAGLGRVVSNVNLPNGGQIPNLPMGAVVETNSLGVVNGVGDGNFAPDRALSREEAAKMLALLAEALGRPLPGTELTFADRDAVRDWAVGFVGQVFGGQIMRGVGGSAFAPRDAYTRQQSITTMLRLYKYVTQ